MTPEQFKEFSTSLRFAFGATDLILGLMILFFAIGTIWMWKDDKPKGERFLLIMGIFFHWLATVNGRSIDLLKESGTILLRHAHFLTTVNLVLVFIAGIFYARGLTQHVWPNYWKWAMAYLISFAFMAFSIMMYTAG